MSLKATLDALKRTGWPALRQTHRADSCIAATALALAVLRQRGYTDAYALTVRVRLANAAATAIMAAHPEGISPAVMARWQQERAKLVVIGEADAKMGQVKLDTKRFVGHLVTIVPPCEEAPRGILLDLSIGQAARPDYGLHVGPLTTATSPDFLEGRDELVINRADGSQIAYEAFPGISSYTVSPDWQEPKRIAAALAATIAAIK